MYIFSCLFTYYWSFFFIHIFTVFEWPFFFIPIIIYSLSLLFYISLLFLLSLILTNINLCSVVFSSIPYNFKRGFYSIIISSLRYRFNYWLILFHFSISEQESILGILLVYRIQTLNSNIIIIILYIILFIDLFVFFIFDQSLYCPIGIQPLFNVFDQML